MINEGAEAISIAVENTSDHAVSVGSHYHFFEANRRLRFDRALAYGMRLDIPSGSAVRWEPGQSREVQLIRLGGRRRVHGFQGLVHGALSETQKAEAVDRARAMGFLDSEA
jgi:urease beta subunit